MGDVAKRQAQAIRDTLAEPLPNWLQTIEWHEGHQRWHVRRTYSYAGKEYGVSFLFEGEATTERQAEVLALMEDRDHGYPQNYEYAVRKVMARHQHPELWAA